MSGFQSKRFVDLPQSVEKHLICSICLDIYNNAVKSECEHTFCKSCLQNWIESNHKNCPECRLGFIGRKRSNNRRSDRNLVIISNFVFINNMKINDIINELKIKCDFESNGCQEVIELGLLSDHLKNCEHRLCKTCGFTVGRDVEHNCLELMKTDRNQLKAKLNEIKVKNLLLKEEIEKLKTNEKEWNLKYNQIKDENKKLEKESNNKINELKLKVKEKTFEPKNQNNLIENNSNEISNLSILKEDLKAIKAKNEFKEEFISLLSKQLTNITLNALTIYFGTHLTLFSKMYLCYYGIYFDSTEFRNSVQITFKSIEELKICSDPSFPFIILRTDSQSCDEMRKRIQLIKSSKGWFDVKSKDPNERYIIIKFCAQTPAVNLSVRISIIFYAFRHKPDLKCQSIDVNEAKNMFNRVSKHQTIIESETIILE